MIDEIRPDPDKLLKSIQKNGESVKGKLKIFFGMAAGVGKTYAMLSAAQIKRKENIDIAVGYAETHGRTETDKLLEGLECIPPKKISYKGVTLREMDLEAILKRKPQIVLVDELAHTNAPGSLHPKRYQDVMELIDSGISVYTTINVQHIESRLDTVKQITGVTVCETVPDTLIENADEIELIDISPDELIKRLNEGKVYKGANAGRALDNFFIPENLTALRELALRLTAERVGQELQDYSNIKPEFTESAKTSDKLMVAIGPSPFSAQLIRWTRRMAYNMKASWIAVYIETGKSLSLKAHDQLEKNISLASSLGAEIVTKFDQDIVMGLVRVAKSRSVTQIVIGKPMRPLIIELMNGGSLTEKLIRKSGNIDIYVVRCELPKESETQKVKVSKYYSPELNEYIYSFLTLSAITLFCMCVADKIGYKSIASLYLLAILFMATAFSRACVLISAAVSSLLWNYLFLPPKFTFYIEKFEDILMFLMYFIIAIIVGNLTFKIKTSERELRKSEEKTTALYTLLKDISSAAGIDSVINQAAEKIMKTFAAKVYFFIADKKGELKLKTSPKLSESAIDEREFSAANWSYKNSKTAGRYTDTLPAARGTYFPLLTISQKIGTMGIINESNDEKLDFEQKLLLESFANQIAEVMSRELSRSNYNF